MGKKGAAAKQQKRAHQEMKSALEARDAALKEAADWAQGSNAKRAQREAAAEAKRQAKLQAKQERRADEMNELSEILQSKKPKGKARKAQRAAGGYRSTPPAFGTDGKKKKKKKKKKAAATAATRKKRDIASPAGEVRGELAPNLNRLRAIQLEEGIHEATGLDGSLAAALAVASPGRPAAAVDRNPERRMKAAFAAYSEKEMARLKQERPQLRRGQVQEIIFKSWQRSAENPMNAQR